MPTDPVIHVVIDIIGDRNYPIRRVKLPTHIVSDLANLMDNSLRLNPALTFDEVVRSIWRHGSRLTRNNLSRGIAPTISGVELPEAASVPVKNDPGITKSTSGSQTPGGGNGTPGNSAETPEGEPAS